MLSLLPFCFLEPLRSESKLLLYQKQTCDDAQRLYFSACKEKHVKKSLNALEV